MGKAQRLKAVRAEERKKPEVINTIAINLLSDGGVNVSGPIQNPVVVIDVLGRALNALSQYYAQEHNKQNRIVKPQNGLILP